MGRRLMAQQQCKLCNRTEQVVPDGRGFPPDIAKRRLKKWCNAYGCPSEPAYTPTIRVGPPPCGQTTEVSDGQ